MSAEVKNDAAKTNDPVATTPASTPATTPATTPAQKPDKPKGEKQFAIESLRKSCRKLLGVTESTFDGATSALDGKGKYTIEQMKKIIKDWGDKPVASPKKKEGK